MELYLVSVWAPAAKTLGGGQGQKSMNFPLPVKLIPPRKLRCPKITKIETVATPKVLGVRGSHSRMVILTVVACYGYILGA